MLGQLMGSMAPMMLSITAGGMLGHLAQRSFGQYDLPVPRQPSDELLLVLPNVDAFGADWSIEARDLRLWLCIHEITHHAVLGVPHVRARARDAHRRVRRRASAPDPNHWSSASARSTSPTPTPWASCSECSAIPRSCSGPCRPTNSASCSPASKSLIALVVGYVDHVMDSLGDRLLGNYGMITEALRRRRVESVESDRFVARLFGLEISQATYDAGAAFVDGVVERSGFDALDPLWRDEKFLPTPAEIDAPGLWLARIEIPDA